MPIELAAYAILRETHQLIGFATVEEARAWKETNHHWMEFGWSAPLWKDWKTEQNEKAAKR
jgi:hypothetical protein